MLTPKQAAARACISLSLVYALLHSKRLRGYRVGARGRGKWLIDEGDLDGFLASCKEDDQKPQDDGSPYQFLK